MGDEIFLARLDQTQRLTWGYVHQTGCLPSFTHQHMQTGRFKVTLLGLLVSELLFTLKNSWGPQRAFVYIDYTYPS